MDKASVVKAIRLTWLSLESHLDNAISPHSKKKCCNEAVGGKAFHKKCVEEYVFVLSVLAHQL